MKRLLTLGAALAMAGCASLHSDPPRVMLEGIEPSADQTADQTSDPPADQASDQRMRVKLRVQNPNDTPITYNGIYVELLVQGKTFGSGVSNQSGTVPGFGEQVFVVPLSISVMSVVGQVVSLLGSSSSDSGGLSFDKISYEMRGKLGSIPFKSKGETTLPGMSASPAAATPVGGNPASR